MAYAINEKGTCTCHAKQWPSTPSKVEAVMDRPVVNPGVKHVVFDVHRVASILVPAVVHAPDRELPMPEIIHTKAHDCQLDSFVELPVFDHISIQLFECLIGRSLDAMYKRDRDIER